ncbi:MAG TPA: TIGR03067 domain-containing protein [Bryobacteraceae bacterium]|nr:TIGR03067 domain-containing protein [Bryobacteraceae bacterium]
MNGDLKKLQGEWSIQALEVDGQSFSPLGSKIAIGGEGFTTNGMGAVYEGRVELRPRKRPKEFDFVFTKGPEKGNRSLGIYELDGDVWRICFTMRGGDRPKAFATKPGSGLALETLRRGVGAKEDAPTTDSAADSALAGGGPLVGEWSLVSCALNGEAIEESLLKFGKRVDDGRKVIVSFGSQVVLRASYTTDWRASPHTIDFRLLNGGRTRLGIFDLSGDTLKVCHAAPDDPRPTEYVTARGDDRTLAVWKRV